MIRNRNRQNSRQRNRRVEKGDMSNAALPPISVLKQSPRACFQKTEHEIIKKKIKMEDKQVRSPVQGAGSPAGRPQRMRRMKSSRAATCAESRQTNALRQPPPSSFPARPKPARTYLFFFFLKQTLPLPLKYTREIIK